MLTPLVKGFNPYESSKPLETKDIKKYQSTVGVINFISNTARPDVSFAASLSSRLLVTPNVIHLKVAYRVLQYLVQSKEKGICYEKNSPSLPYKDFRYLDTTKNVSIVDYPKLGKYTITAVSDSDHAADVNDRISQTGYAIYINNNLVTWCSRKQKSVSISSTEAEYMSLSECSRTGLYFRNLMEELNLDVSYIDLVSDNRSALILAAHKYNHSKTKHIAIHYHFIRNLVKNKVAKLNYINTSENVSDILTKTLDTTSFTKLSSKLLN